MDPAEPRRLRTTGARFARREPPPTRRRLFTVVTLVVGLVALAIMMRSIGWGAIRAALGSVGVWLPVAIALDLLGLGCDAAALHGFMGVDAANVGASRVLAAQATGRAINILTPGGALGEPTKLEMLARHVPQARALSALVLLNLATVYVAIAVIVIGVPITLIAADLPRTLEITVLVALAVVIPLVIAVGFLLYRGALASLSTWLRRLHVIGRKRAASWEVKLAEVDRDLHDLQGGRRAVAFVVLSRVLEWAAALVLLHAVAITITAKLVIGVFSVGVLLSWVAALVPFGLGVADGGSYALYGLLGATGAHGIVMAMLSRIRQLAIALVGLAIMVLANRGDRARGDAATHGRLR